MRAGASIVTLMRRMGYGGRKGRRAARRFGEVTVRELDAAGIPIIWMEPGDPEPEGPCITIRMRQLV